MTNQLSDQLGSERSSGPVETAALGPWQKPSFEEVAMNAEIGAYQAEPGNDSPYAPRVDPEQLPSLR